MMKTGVQAKWLSIFFTTSLIFWLAITPASALRLAGPAVDGDGLMSVSPTNVTYGTSAVTLTFTFEANNDFGSGSQVVLTFPAGWTTPTTGPGAGHISVNAGSCSLTGYQIKITTSNDLFVDMNSCTTGSTFTITYANAVPGSITGSPYDFITQTDIGANGQGLVPINAPMPSVTIDPRMLTVNSSGLTPANKQYDSLTGTTLTTGTPGLVGVLPADAANVSLVTTGATADFVDAKAGIGKTVNISGLTLSGSAAGNYGITPPTRSANISKRPITITAVTDTKTYDGTTSSSGVPGLTGALAGSDTATWTQTFDTRNTGTGKTLTPAGLVSDGNSGNNYAYTYVTNTTGVINKLGITVTAVTSTKVYDGGISSTGTPVLSAGTPLASGDSAPNWTQTFANKHGGSGKTLTPAGAVIDGNNGANYTYTFVNDTTGQITARALTVTAKIDSKVFDGDTTSSVAPQVSPALSGTDTPAFSQAFDTRDKGTNKTLTPSGLANDGNGGNNYTYTYSAITTGEITAKALTVSAAGLTPDDKTYDGTTAATFTLGSPELVGVVAPDVVTLNTGAAAAAFASRNAGSARTVNISGLTIEGAGAGNYTLTQPTRSANVAKRAVTITAASDTKTYDGNTSSSQSPSLSPGTPLAPGDSEPVWTQAFNNKHAGTGKTLTPAGLVLDGNSGLNYAYTYTPDTSGVINQRAITVSAVADSRTYNGLTNSSKHPTITAGTLQGTDTPAFTQTFNNRHAGTGKTLTPAGIVNDGNGGANYAVSFSNNLSGVILPLHITVTAQTASKVYDGTTKSTVLPKISPALMAPDTSGFIQTFNTPTVGTGKTLIPSGSAKDGNLGHDYAVTFIRVSTGTISKATPLLSVMNSPVVFNGLPQSAVVKAGSVTGTVKNIKYNGSLTAPTNPGTYVITADFVSTNPNYKSVVGANAGKFSIITERILNGSFSTFSGVSKIPSSWLAASFGASDGKDISVFKDAPASVRMIGAASKVKTLSQPILLGGPKGSTFYLSFWVKASALPVTGLCQAQVLFYNGNLLKGSQTVACPAGATYTWSQVKMTFNAPDAYTKIMVKFTYSKASGTVWFDKVSLMR